MADTITAKILRYDPSTDAEPYYATYEVPWEEDTSGFMTGLQVLHAIYENQDDVAYDFCCRSGLCGRCSMVIDGKVGLACWARIERGSGEHTFEPLPGFPVVRDLVVDRERTYNKLLKVIPQTQTIDPISEVGPMDQDLWWNTLERINMCRECMSCYAVCPVVNDAGKWDSYAGPAALMVIAHQRLAGRELSDRLLQSVYEGVFDCIQCGMCTQVCPSNIEITKLIGDLQAAAEERGLKPATA